MTRNRLEAFSDGVIAILITIMVLELNIPHGDGWEALVPLIPVFFAYVLSFVMLAIYWNNHHHMLHATRHIDGNTLWANTHLLFWLSLIPFATAWMGENHFAPLPTAVYGTVLLLCGLAYYILQHIIVDCGGMAPEVVDALRSDFKGKISVAIYAIAIPLAFVHQAIAGALYVGVALMWLVPDRRIESALHASAPSAAGPRET
jgi:uncharacterized membrane protein